MTGRTRADVMQKSSTCNFMYGDLTDKETIKKVEKAFEDQTPLQVELVIYKRNSKYTKQTNRINRSFPQLSLKGVFCNSPGKKKQMRIVSFSIRLFFSLEATK